MRIITPTILAFFLTLLSPLARASTCTDWSQSRSLPQFEPGILGDLCQVKDNTAYVADSELKIIDLSDPEFARIAGTLPLPGTATDLQVRGDFAYLIVDGFPLVEVDVSQPSSPLITRSYPETGTFSDVVALDPYMAVLDDQSRLHIFDVTQGGPLARIATHPLPLSAVTDIGRIGSFLVIWDNSEIVVMDYADPLALEVTCRIGEYLGEYSVFGPDFLIFGYYESEIKESFFNKITVDETGLAHRSWLPNLDGHCIDLAATQSMFFALDIDNNKYANQYAVFEIGGGGLITRFEAPGETAMGLSPTRFAGVSPSTGFHWIDINELGSVPSLNSFGIFRQGSECQYIPSWESCRSTLGWMSGPYWIEVLHEWNEGWDGYNSSYRSHLFDLHDPLNPVHVYYNDGLKNLPVVWDGRWLILVDNFCSEIYGECLCLSRYFQLIDLKTMAQVQSWTSSTLVGLGRDGILWVYEFENVLCISPFELKCYKVDETGGVSEIANLGPMGGYSSLLKNS